MHNASTNLRIENVPVALLAGGLATRLGPMAAATPKALLTIAGRPFIDHQLALLRAHGIRRVVLCVAHMGRQIENYVGDGSSFGMEIRFSQDGPALAGTGGAIRRALPLLGDAFWVMYGDSYMDIDYTAILRHFADSNAPALMTVVRNDNRWDKSNAIYQHGQLLRYDKNRRVPEMRYIDYGVQLLRAEALAEMPAEGPCDLADVYSRLVADGRMTGFEVFERFYEIGTPGAFEETRVYLNDVARLRAAEHENFDPPGRHGDTECNSKNGCIQTVDQEKSYCSIENQR